MAYSSAFWSYSIISGLEREVSRIRRGISWRQHLGGKVSSAWSAVLTSCEKQDPQYGCRQGKSTDCRSGILSKQLVHSLISACVS